MRVRCLAYMVAMLIVVLGISRAQESKTTVKREAAPTTSPASDKEMFVSYCASCHGKDAKGNGPAANALKQLPADLTTLAKRNGGKYPSDKVASILRGKRHLWRMEIRRSVWGPVFWRMSQGREEQVQMRIANLNRYLESLQEK